MMKKSIKILFNIGTPMAFIFGSMAFGLPFWFPLGIVGTILIHELGHFLIMKLFKYEEASLYLFLPFGGFVLHNRPRQKTSESLIMILAGPVPGIIIGGVFFYLSGLLPYDYLETIGVIMLYINLLNLLPIFPLDGGVFISDLFNIRKKNLLYFSIVSSLVLLFYIFFFKQYFFLIISVIQLVFLFGKGWQKEYYEYDLSAMQAVIFAFFYLVILSVSLWLIYTVG